MEQGLELGRVTAWKGSEVMASGNRNDVEMLEFAGHPVIIRNSFKDLLSRGCDRNTRMTLAESRLQSIWRWARNVYGFIAVVSR
jgi:hypothetical protein